MPTDPNKLLAFVSKHFPDHEVSTAYKAGCCGYYAHRCFEDFGWRSLVVDPADIHSKGKEKHAKTDKKDAQLITRELKDGRLESIIIPDKQREELRSLFRRRNDLVKDFRRIKTYIKMQLLYFGIKEPEEFDNDHWRHKCRKWLDNLVFKHPTAKAALESRMRFLRFVDQELRDVSTQLRRYCKVHNSKDYMLLRSIPTIGGIVACGILGQLGDLRRFSNIKHLAGYVGLTRIIHQSGDSQRTMGMTLRAKRLLRSYFLEATWQAIRTDPIMQAYYRKHHGKKVKRIIVKVARKVTK